MRPPPIDFWERVETGTLDECFHWWGAVDLHTGHGLYKGEFAHHVILPGSTHTCMSPDCVNPRHLTRGKGRKLFSHVRRQPDGCWLWDGPTSVWVGGNSMRYTRAVFLQLNPDYVLTSDDRLVTYCTTEKCILHVEVTRQCSLSERQKELFRSSDLTSKEIDAAFGTRNAKDNIRTPKPAPPPASKLFRKLSLVPSVW